MREREHRNDDGEAAQVGERRSRRAHCSLFAAALFRGFRFKRREVAMTRRIGPALMQKNTNRMQDQKRERFDPVQIQQRTRRAPVVDRLGEWEQQHQQGVNEREYERHGVMVATETACTREKENDDLSVHLSNEL